MSYLKTKYPAKNSDGGSGHSAIGGFYYDLFGKGKTSDFITDLFIVLFYFSNAVVGFIATRGQRNH